MRRFAAPGRILVWGTIPDPTIPPRTYLQLAIKRYNIRMLRMDVAAIELPSHA